MTFEEDSTGPSLFKPENFSWFLSALLDLAFVGMFFLDGKQWKIVIPFVF